MIAVDLVRQIASGSLGFGALDRWLWRAKQAALQGEFRGAVGVSWHRLLIEASDRKGHSV